MAVFELGDGRGRHVRPALPAAAAFEGEVAALLTGHLETVLGEPVLVLRHRTDGTGPPLLALDGAGRPVVVDAAHELDGPALLRALGHAGAAGRWSRADLARLHHRGPEAFEADVADFLARVPLGGATGSGGVAGSDGAAGSGGRPAGHGGWVGAGPGGGVRLVVLCGSVAPGLADAVDHLLGGALEVRQLGVLPGSGHRLVEVAPVALREERDPEPDPGSRPDRATDAFAQAMAHLAAGRRVTSDGVTDGLAHPAPAAAPAVSYPVSTPPVAPVDGGPPPVSAEPVPARAPLEPAPALAALARRHLPAAALVWVRVRRGQRLVVTLLPDGLIALPDGSVFAHPDLAAAAAIAAENPVDGWRVWRLGEGGPTLADAVAALDHPAAPLDSSAAPTATYSSGS